MGETPALADEPGADVEEPDAVDDVEEPAETTVADAADAAQEHDPSSDVNEATVELTDDDLGDGADLFSGVEESDSSPASSGEGDGADDDQDGEGDDEDDALDGIADGLEGNAAAMEDAINDGAARLAVVGLTDADFDDSDLSKDSLETEFRETFEAFRLGYFGSRAVEEYVLAPADNDVSPAWGLAGSALMAAAMIVWLRPDGDQAIERAKDAVGGIGGAA